MSENYDADVMLDQIVDYRANVVTRKENRQNEMATHVAQLRENPAFVELMRFLTEEPVKLQEEYFNIQPGDEPELKEMREKLYNDIHYTQRVLTKIKTWMANKK